MSSTVVQLHLFNQKKSFSRFITNLTFSVKTVFDSSFNHSVEVSYASVYLAVIVLLHVSPLFLVFATRCIYSGIQSL